MNLGRLTTAVALATCTTGLASADTIFTNSTDTDFNNAANWDNGLPDTVAAAGDDDMGIISTGATANMSAGYQLLTGRRFALTVNGTLNTGANELQLRSGSLGTNPRGTNGDVDIDGGIVNVDAGGLIDIAGVGADIFIDNDGTLNVLDGGQVNASKALEVLDGTLFLADGASMGNVSDELLIDDLGTIVFEIDAAGDAFAAISGNTLAVELGATSTLSLAFTSAATTGDSFVLINGVTGFAGVNGGTGTGVFGTVNATGLGTGQSVDVSYTGGELVATVVPEPGSIALLALGGLTLLRRRR